MRRGVFFSAALTFALIAGTAGLVRASEVVESDSALVGLTMTSDIESVSLVSRHWSPGLMTDRSWVDYGLQAFSNETCQSWQIWWDEEFVNSTTRSSVWHSIAPDAFDSVLDTIEAEGFGDLEGTYCDASSIFVETPPETSLTVSLADADKTVSFEGNAMFGIMPGTYCEMGALACDSVSITVSVVHVSGFDYEVSAVVANDGDTEITLDCATADTWRFVVVRENGCTFKGPESPLPYCGTPIAPHSELVLESQEIDASEFCDGNYAVFVNQVGGGFAALTIEGNDAYVNTPPRDRGDVLSRDSSDPGVWTIELLGCCDREDRPEDIMVQWDWESDGEWDTAWLANKTATHDFGGSEELNVTYQLKDSDGAVSLGYVFWSEEAGESTVWGMVSLAATMVVVLAAAVVAVVLLVLRSRRGAKG